MQKKIILLQGGNSPEREISLRSSATIATAIKKLNYDLITLNPADYQNIEDLILTIKKENPNIVFIGLHGGDGEDGTIQAVLKSAKIKFTGSDHTSSAIAMNKFLSSCIAKTLDIPIPDQILINHTDDTKNCEDIINLPIVVKPNSAGSSVGTYIIHNVNDLQNAVEDAFKYDNRVLVQKYINGREMTVSILDDNVLPVIEIKTVDGFYDYSHKYTKGKTEYICPASLTTKETICVQSYAEKIFKTMGCSGYGRVDFIYDGTDFYFLEVNTLPGMTELSLVPMAAKENGIDFVNLIKCIIDN
jgi:D-alanine-D-alanine ligase